jgi:hypothetical protein
MLMMWREYEKLVHSIQHSWYRPYSLIEIQVCTACQVWKDPICKSIHCMSVRAYVVRGLLKPTSLLLPAEAKRLVWKRLKSRPRIVPVWVEFRNNSDASSLSSWTSICIDKSVPILPL